MNSYSVTKAIFDTQELVDSVLTQAGLIDGLTLDNEEVKNETTPLFWFVQVASKVGSEKPTYVTYTITSADRYHSGDGKVINRKVICPVTVFSRNRDIRSIVESIDSSFRANNWRFKFSSVQYNFEIKMFIYEFVAEAVVSDG